MSLSEFRNAQRGFFDKQKGELRQRWETARFISYHTLIPHMKKGRKLNLKDVVLFEWEKEDKQVKPMTDEEVRYIMTKMGKYIDANGNFHN